ncbi:response regulator [Lentibacillus saliphilus]|uniref:response regulator n=1 Tax=Lentibacillus saliphilus TaxID=2737028 RepID=UPI001C3081DB|nr:response regulator [Lentibacillus saliphilus]
MYKDILVVDDQPGIRLLLQDVLANEGYKVATRETGQEALEALRKTSYALVILDYKLPVMDGVEVLKQLEAEQNKTPAILISGLAEEMSQSLKNISNLKEIIAKPFNVQHICTVVNQIIQQSYT